MFYVYLIKNKLNNKVYVGKTNNLKKRWKSHVLASRIKNKKHFLIHRAINKYGEDNFELSILDVFENDLEALDKEIYWISFYKSNVCKYGKEFGYNLTDGGEGVSGHIVSDETRKKMSDAAKIRKYSLDHSEIMSKALSGKVRSNDSKLRYHDSKLGIKNPNSKLNDCKVKEIKLLLSENKLSCKQIGLLYGVDRKTISDIKLNKCWKHVK